MPYSPTNSEALAGEAVMHARTRRDAIADLNTEPAERPGYLLRIINQSEARIVEIARELER